MQIANKDSAPCVLKMFNVIVHVELYTPRWVFSTKTKLLNA